MIRYEGAIQTAMFVGLMSFSAIWLIAESKSWIHRLLYFTALIPFIVVFFLAKSRGPQLALLLTFPVFIYFQNQHYKKIIVFLLVSLLIAIALFLTFPDITKMLFSRGITAPYRIEIWKIALQESLHYFWFGQGYSHTTSINTSLGKFGHSHNILLSVFRMGGIVGVFFFSCHLLLCLFSGLKNQTSTHRLWIIWLIFGIFCLMTNGKYPLSRPSTSWLGYWVPIAFICASYSKFLSQKNKL